jgi:NifU-like protein involved in Fe-S cluster formation
MKRLVIAVAVIALGGCGVETATTAATGAAIKKRELEEGQKTQERMKQKIDQAMEQAQQRAQQSDDSNAR